MDFNPANRKAIALVLLVFGLGIAIGAVGNSLVNRRVYGALERRQEEQGAVKMPGDRVAGRARLVKKLTEDLNLTPQQQTQLTDILQNTQSGYDSIRRQMDPEFNQVRSAGRDRIRQILTSDQRSKFDDFIRRVDEEHHRNKP